MPNGTSDLQQLWDHANENARNIALVKQYEENCGTLVLKPMQEDLRKLSSAVLDPRDGLITKVDGLLLHQQEAAVTADKVKAAADDVAVQLQQDREARIAREAIADENLKRDKRIRWLIAIGISLAGLVVAGLRAWASL